MLNQIGRIDADKISISKSEIGPKISRFEDISVDMLGVQASRS
jgi:hypothetical protein